MANEARIMTMVVEMVRRFMLSGRGGFDGVVVWYGLQVEMTWDDNNARDITSQGESAIYTRTQPSSRDL
jgi:hypothetical protein